MCVHIKTLLVYTVLYISLLKRERKEREGNSISAVKVLLCDPGRVQSQSQRKFIRTDSTKFFSSNFFIRVRTCVCRLQLIISLMHSAEEAFSYAEVAAVCTRIDAGLVKNITYRSERGGALLKPAKEIKKNIKIEAI